METTADRLIDSATRNDGTHEKARSASALGVARLHIDRSYKGASQLLTQVIRNADRDAWEQIKEKIDYIYQNLDVALSALDRDTNFLSELRARLDRGQKILFKPNLVSMESINPYTLTSGSRTKANTEWPFVAAVLRWFHDKAGISYYQMSLGEAATISSMLPRLYTRIKGNGRPVTAEATMEGRSDDFYGGWGFYFARRYLAEASDPTMGDDPMRGLEESMAGVYLPPGLASDRLMVYDLNQVSDDLSRGREITVPRGENFKSIILHKAIVGGDPSDPEDCASYPGSILINLPKLKVHVQAIITNAIKNLGIGLFPMQASRSGDCHWEYASPHSPVPTLKSGLPHQVWVPEMDPETCLPKRDSKGDYVVHKTGGLTGTMLDVLRALKSLDISMLHIVDAIETINRDHQGVGLGAVEEEGLLVAGTDIVATDLFCARYLFSNVAIEESEQTGLTDRFGGAFVQAVPIPQYNGKDIVTDKGYDCLLARDYSLTKAEEEGLGTSAYYVVGRDDITDNPLASFRGRLGVVDNGAFSDVHTKSFYSAVYKMPWDMQATFFGYLNAVDQLEHTSLRKEFLAAFDEDGDGVVTYEECGKKGMFTPNMLLVAHYTNARVGDDESEIYRAYFAMNAVNLRCSNPLWNAEGHDFCREQYFGNIAVVAQMMSRHPAEEPDPFFPDLLWGNGKWPSFSLASLQYARQVTYGWKFPSRVGVFSLYGSALTFADIRQNNREFVGPIHGFADPDAAQNYIDTVLQKRMKPLDFTLFVPTGCGAGDRVPNVRETSDPNEIFTASFEGEKIRWP